MKFESQISSTTSIIVHELDSWARHGHSFTTHEMLTMFYHSRFLKWIIQVFFFVIIQILMVNRNNLVLISLKCIRLDLWTTLLPIWRRKKCCWKVFISVEIDRDHIVIFMNMITWGLIICNIELEFPFRFGD